jgi:hypothetical protein
MKFRETCVLKLPSWAVSSPREMGLGSGFTTASGVAHEVDVIVHHDPMLGILELKNRPESPPDNQTRMT